MFAEYDRAAEVQHLASGPVQHLPHGQRLALGLEVGRDEQPALMEPRPQGVGLEEGFVRVAGDGGEHPVRGLPVEEEVVAVHPSDSVPGRLTRAPAPGSPLQRGVAGLAGDVRAPGGQRPGEQGFEACDRVEVALGGDLRGGGLIQPGGDLVVQRLGLLRCDGLDIAGEREELLQGEEQLRGDPRVRRWTVGFFASNFARSSAIRSGRRAWTSS